MKSEENIFLLSNEGNYYSKLNCTIGKINESYISLVNFYISYSIENMNIKDKEIFYTGISVVNNVFRLILLYTRNLELTIYHTQQCIYYYVEYISQITDKEDNIFFNLSIKDAVIYVYTRTIFEIKKAYIKQQYAKDNTVFNSFTSTTQQYNTMSNICSKYLFTEEIDTVKKQLNDIGALFIIHQYNDDDILKASKLGSFNEMYDHLVSVAKQHASSNNV